MKAPATIVTSRTIEDFTAFSLWSRHSDPGGPQTVRRMRRQSDAVRLPGGQPVCEVRIDFACQAATSQTSSEIAVSSPDHLADDFRHQVIPQDHRKATRVRQLPAMRFHETDAVEQQRLRAPACKRNASRGDGVHDVRIATLRRKHGWALERFRYAAL